jgi:multiple sugar transport system permease protein
MLRTVAFTVVSVFFDMFLGVGIALVLNEKFIGRGFLRGVMILPWALPSVVNAVMWKWIYNGNYGALNALLTQIGIIPSYKVWLGSTTSAFLSMLFANVWKETPYVVLLTIAALSTIDKTLYESARVDGAGSVRTLLSITIPVIRPILIILIITKSIWAIQTFDLVYILTAGGPAGSTELIAYYIYKTTFKFNNFGYAAAMSYVLSFITFIMAIMYIKLLAKDNEVI